MKKNNQLQKFNNFVIFQTDQGKVNIDVFFANDNLWLTQKVMAELFDTTKQNISLHLQNIFDEGELSKKATVKDFLTVQKEGRREISRKIEFYSLDAIIAVGYRVNSKRATKFRIWATKILQEFIIKSDVLIAKNYLDEKHIEELNRIVSAYLDLAENRAKRGIVMNMKDWVKFLDRFLELANYPILVHKGKVSAEKARLKAEVEYKAFRVGQDKNYISDFDREVEKLLAGSKEK